MEKGSETELLHWIGSESVTWTEMASQHVGCPDDQNEVMPSVFLGFVKVIVKFAVWMVDVNEVAEIPIHRAVTDLTLP